MSKVLKWLEDEADRLLEEYDSNSDPYKTVNNSFLEGFNYALANVQGLQQPQLNENQQIVLEWLKEEYAERNLFPTEVAWLLLESFDNGYFEPEEERAFENLNKLQEAQVLQAFATWVEQEED